MGDCRLDPFRDFGKIDFPTVDLSSLDSNGKRRRIATNPIPTNAPVTPTTMMTCISSVDDQDRVKLMFLKTYLIVCLTVQMSYNNLVSVISLTM